MDLESVLLKQLISLLWTIKRLSLSSAARIRNYSTFTRVKALIVFLSKRSYKNQPASFAVIFPSILSRIIAYFSFGIKRQGELQAIFLFVMFHALKYCSDSFATLYTVPTRAIQA
jgi:hypothetical protein